MRLIYKGYAITTYGKSSMSITDREGKEVLHSNNFQHNEEDFLKKYLKEFVNGGGKSGISE